MLLFSPDLSLNQVFYLTSVIAGILLNPNTKLALYQVQHASYKVRGREESTELWPMQLLRQFRIA